MVRNEYAPYGEMVGWVLTHLGGVFRRRRGVETHPTITNVARIYGVRVDFTNLEARFGAPGGDGFSIATDRLAWGDREVELWSTSSSIYFHHAYAS